MIRYKFIFCFAFTIVACTSNKGTFLEEIKAELIENENKYGKEDVDEVHKEKELVTINYEESFEDFANPERGFYRTSFTSGSSYTFLSKTGLEAFRRGSFPYKANYDTKSTLLYRNYILDDFVDSDITATFLANMQTDFDVVRAVGMKMILRFSYINEVSSGDCSTGSICPPYGDAKKNRVLSHINQISSVLSSNSDVISCLQMGLIGIWGENYFTDYFGDTSGNGSQDKLLDTNWKDRIEVLEALLRATPKEMMIQVRYPQLKQRYVYGVNAKTNVPALTVNEAFSGEDKARLGFHNDCFLSGVDDSGTYFDYGNSSSHAQLDIENLKTYFVNDGAYVPVGGETCSDNYSPENNCGGAEFEMEKLHYSFLNAEFALNVNNDWVSGGCMAEIKRKLGYRYVLTSAIFPKEMDLDERLSIELNIKNIGYANLYNKKHINIVLKHTSTNESYIIRLPVDVRMLSKTFTIKEKLILPASITPGNYKLYLSICDGNESLSKNPLFNIQLANTGIWDPKTGYNNLNHSIVLQDKN